jgi:hypothetical protein
MWSIWRERNRRLFEDHESKVMCLKSLFFFFLLLLRFLLDYAVVYVPNFSSSNLLNIFYFLDCNSLYGVWLSCILLV